MSWGKARKKPVVVEFRYPDKPYEIIRTLEGDMIATFGTSLVIMGVDGEEYPIKISIFEKTYDVIESAFCAEKRNDP